MTQAKPEELRPVNELHKQISKLKTEQNQLARAEAEKMVSNGVDTYWKARAEAAEARMAALEVARHIAPALETVVDTIQNTLIVEGETAEGLRRAIAGRVVDLARSVNLRPDGMPASKDERQLRRMLCAAIETNPYMDDGEASGDGIDYMRFSVADIQAALDRRNMERYLKEQEKGGTNG